MVPSSLAITLPLIVALEAGKKKTGREERERGAVLDYLQQRNRSIYYFRFSIARDDNVDERQRQHHTVRGLRIYILYSRTTGLYGCTAYKSGATVHTRGLYTTPE